MTRVTRGEDKLTNVEMGGEATGEKLMNMVAHVRGLMCDRREGAFNPCFRSGYPCDLGTWTRFGPACQPETCPGMGREGAFLVPLTGCVSGFGILPVGTSLGSGSASGSGLLRHLRLRAGG